MSNTIQALDASVDAAVYEAMQKAQPAFVSAVRDLVARGETPARIERHLRRSFGNVQVVRDARHVAEHIQRNGLTHKETV
jgi:hypothetical protein